jgi:hypothetical protein
MYPFYNVLVEILNKYKSAREYTGKGSKTQIDKK